MFLIPDPWVQNSLPLARRLPGHRCYTERVEGEPIFLQGTWFFPCALGTGDVITWALLQLLQALHLALLSELLVPLLSNLFRPSELGFFELQVLFWPKEASEQLWKWFRYCAPVVCYHLWVCLCLENDVSVPMAQLPTSCLGTLKVWTCLLQFGGSLLCVCRWEHHEDDVNLSPCFRFFLKIDQKFWVVLNIIWFFQFYSLVRKWNSELCAL